MQATGLASGTLYPLLVRLERAGWVAARWEDIDFTDEAGHGYQFGPMVLGSSAARSPGAGSSHRIGAAHPPS
jgi:hypothetical protein